MKHFASGLDNVVVGTVLQCFMFPGVGVERENLFRVSYIYQKLKSMKPQYFLQSGYIRVVFDHDDIVFSQTTNLSL